MRLNYHDRLDELALHRWEGEGGLHGPDSSARLRWASQPGSRGPHEQQQ